jgi:hypothetical protein
MRRKTRTVYYVNTIDVRAARHTVLPDSYSYDYQDAQKFAHDYTYALAVRGGSYWSPRDGVFLMSYSYSTSFPDFRVEVLSSDDGIELY